MSAIKIKGLRELIAKLDKVGRGDAVRDGLRAAALHVKGKVAHYPPSSEANTPGQRRWYQRGYGPKWTLANGTVHGKKTSETLGRKWTMQEYDFGMTWVIGNNVSYGPFVQGEEQAAFHRARGWKTTEDISEQESERVLKFIQTHVKDALEE